MRKPAGRGAVARHRRGKVLHGGDGGGLGERNEQPLAPPRHPECIGARGGTTGEPKTCEPAWDARRTPRFSIFTNRLR